MPKLSPTKTAALAVIHEAKIAPSANLDALQKTALLQLEKVRQIESEAALRAILAGMALHRIKASLPHGKFTPWLKASAHTVGHRQANYYMRLAEVALAKTKATRPELLALPGDQTQLALDGFEGDAKALMRKLGKFVGDLSLGELLHKHGIKDSGKRGGNTAAAAEAGDESAAAATPPTAEQLAEQAKESLAAWLEDGRQLLLTDHVAQYLDADDLTTFRTGASDLLAQWQRKLRA